MLRMTYIVLILLLATPCISTANVIDVQIKGVDDGVKTNKQQDYNEAVLFAKREAIERAGVEVKALTTAKDFVIHSDYIESKAEAVLLPGYNVVDVGYQKDGTYLVILIGKVKTIAEGIDSKELRFAKSLMDRGQRPKAEKIVDNIIKNSKDDNAVAEAMYCQILWEFTKNEIDLFEKLKAYYPNYKKLNSLYNIIKQRGGKYIIGAISSNDIYGLNKLINWGIDVNSKYNNKIPYMEAVKQGKISIAKLLIDNGAKLKYSETYYNDEEIELAKIIYKAYGGDRRKMFKLAFRYSNGKGVTKDASKAFSWYKKSAEAGDVSSMNNLGVCYDKGNGVTKSKKTAFYWYKKAAESGNSTAMRNVGLSYQYGDGVERNERIAIYWFYKAVKKGNERGETSLEKILKCKECDGSGKCIRCDGKGEWISEVRVPPKTCPLCKGSGRIDLGNRRCTYCGGRGVRGSGYTTRKENSCSYCNASGKCKKCDGTGKNNELIRELDIIKSKI